MKHETYLGIRQTLAEIIKGTAWEGHVYLVGGCVRDEIMQRKIHDIDLAVDIVNGGIKLARWLQRNKHTARGRSVLVFEHFGTAKVRLRKFPKDIIDIVQTRKDKYVYEEQPHPERNFGTVLQDAVCRDLTINSLYINVSSSELLDPTGYGRQDIANHVLRTPNDVDITLTDNPMHVLRCIRFAVKYGWELNQELIEALKRNVDILAESTPRRLIKELYAIMELRDKEKALQLIEMVGAKQYVAPFMGVVRMMKEKGITPDQPLRHHSHHRGGHDRRKAKDKLNGGKPVRKKEHSQKRSHKKKKDKKAKEEM